jgi:radical SAM protein with 4Fe4S-binding SPASM domain
MLEPSDFPARLTLELTNRCNYQCAMCPSRWQPDIAKGLMDAGLFYRLVDEAAEHLPVTLVPFFRGESLVHPQAVEMIAYAKKRGLGPVQLASNGWLLDHAAAGGLLDAGVDFISFSLDSIRADEYREIRKGGELAQVLANINHFLELRRAGGYSTTVQVSATRTGLNQDSIQEFIDFWQGRVDRVRIYYEHSADGHAGSLACPEVPSGMPRQPCRKPFEDMVVYYDGGVAACNHDWFRTPPLGSVLENGIQAVWHNRNYQDLRGQHLNAETLQDSSCLNCDHWKLYYLDTPFIGELYESATEESHVRQA